MERVVSKIEMIDMEPTLPVYTKEPIELITEIIKYLLTVESDSECLEQWKEVETGLTQYNIQLSPTTWSIILEHTVIGNHVRELHPKSEELILNLLRNDNSIPERLVGHKREMYSKGEGWVTVEQYIEDKGWVKVNR